MPVPGAEGPTLSAEEPTLSSESHTGRTGVLRIPAPAGPARPAPLLPGLERFNTAPSGAAETALLACCGSRRWGRRIVAHRPYPDLDALLAAADEAGYDLGSADLDEALGDECSSGLHPGAPTAAHTALRAALTAYESRFGHAFVICLDGFRPDEQPDQVLAAIRSRLGNDPDEERVVAADELRRLARARLAHLVADRPDEPEPAPIARPCLFDHT
ncbi:2-oxo-4-hydroxy-4-carboxy-5-ureidoimidazoline decarboxylase [Streptomyces formicae]|uniref:2-oxo-4-hydroxy-4-carboxy-5-ureidoimidazoline decarboxylase n=1 Tax=Streptomyces formicae TaxID=1616117 RepID=A0ABY3WGY1_9ACTN|nr:2-oxo-4-hydroxy-4-carboxy-5-ureidoimidazoline decarboxylase [Streptomyces formicae]UNM10886.1 2-oxo-4-hydroxy-4-carboxy-5-ureidoimidazoline decarboxylase [Streptomyces formicae]